MKTASSSEEGRLRTVVVIAVVLILSPLGVGLANFALALGSGDSEPFLDIPEEAGEECVRETEYMRFHHMDLLKELRDFGVRGGARRSLTFLDCRECHVSRERFCAQCHQAVNLSPDCFECHYYP